MKTFLLFVITVLAVPFLPLKNVRAQDPITNYSGIPLVVYQVHPWRMTYPDSYEKMKNMGLYGAAVDDVLDLDSNNGFIPYLEYFREKNIKVVPSYWGGRGSEIQSYINEYTDAYYTVWEAEGTDPAKGKATLYRNDNTEIDIDDNIISVKAGEEMGLEKGDAIIFGPGYPQNIDYAFHWATIFYSLETRLKVDTIAAPPPNYLNDTVCTIKITNLWSDSTYLLLKTVDSLIVKVSDFNGWNSWQTFLIDNYDLVEQRNYADSSGKNYRASFVEFKVIWGGLDYLDLFIDKMKVYDNKGWELVNTSGFQSPKYLITTQVEGLINDTLVIGWYGLDEPAVLDNYECFRIVDSLIQSVPGSNIRLHSGFYGGDLGRFKTGGLWWTYPDTMTINLYMDEEYWLRAKQKNIQINLYNYQITQPSN